MKQLLRVLAGLLILGTGLSAQVREARGALLDLSQERQAIQKMLPAITSWDILLVTFDAAQASRFAILEGKQPEPMPHLEELAGRSHVFTRAFSPSPHRQAALMALHHSLYPMTVAGLGDSALTESLASAMGDGGYTTWAVFHSLLTRKTREPVGRLHPRMDFDRRRYANYPRLGDMLKFAGTVTEVRRSGERFLGWVHLDFPRPPARHHPGISLGNRPEDHYRAALRYTDQAIGSLLDQLKKAGRADKTIVVVCGLHGLKKIPAGGQLIQNELDDETLRVPLVIHVPGLKPARVSALVETVDVAPTLMDLADVSIPWSFQGRSLLRHLLQGEQYKGNRVTFSSHLEMIQGSPHAIVERVRGGYWTLHYGPKIKPGILHRDGQEGNLISTRLDKAKELGLLLEEFQIMNEHCIWLWKQGNRVPADLSGPDGDIARARFYARRRHRTAIVTARRILKQGSRHLEEALEILVRMGAKESPDDLKPLLAHPALRVRSLAAALLLSTAPDQNALDYIASGLQDGKLPLSTRKALVEALLATRPDGGREVLAAFKPDQNGSLELQALRDLALAHMGDEDAIERLPRHLLLPHAPYDRGPFFAALAQYRPKRMAGLCRIILVHGDGEETLTLSALGYLFEHDVREAAYAVAQVIRPGASAAVIQQAVNLLNFWQSPEGVVSCLGLGRGGLAQASLAARVLFATPAIVDSPILPSRRFDHYASERSNGQLDAIETAADMAQKELRFNVQVTSRQNANVSLLFKARLDDGSLPDPSTLRLHLSTRDNDVVLSDGLLELKDGFYSWTAAVPSNWIEAGTTTFSARLSHRHRRKLAGHALAFVLFPATAQTPRPVAGIDTHPLGGNASLRRSGGHINPKAGRTLFWVRRDGPGRPLGEIRVMANGKTFMRIASKDLQTPRVFPVTLPEGTTRATKIELLCVDVPEDTALTALFFERP